MLLRPVRLAVQTRQHERQKRQQSPDAAHADGFPSFVHVEVLRHRLDIGAMGETALRFQRLQARGGEIVPAELRQELIPDHAVRVVQRAALRLAPGEDFLVAATFQHALPERGIVDVQEAGAPTVGALSEIGVKILAQLAARVPADLVEHAGEIEQAINLVEGAAGDGRGSHGRSVIHYLRQAGKKSTDKNHGRQRFLL